MIDRFPIQITFAEKTAQPGAKSLATELVIPFQGAARKPVPMQRPSFTEFSLFSVTGARKYLNAAERRRFLVAISELPVRQKLFCEVLAWSGGRISEVLALEPDAIDVEQGVVALLTLKRRRTGLVRQIPLPRWLIRALVCEYSLNEVTELPNDDDARLWPWSRATAWRLIKRVMADASLSGPAASPKGLRHAFGVQAFQANVPPHLVQRWLGHASLRTTTIYADVSGREERQFASRMWRR